MVKAKPVNRIVVQVYAPTSTHSGKDVEEFYGMIEQAKTQCKTY